MENFFVSSFIDLIKSAITSWGKKGMDIAKGTKVFVKGTIKEHNEYAGVKQTVLTRCSIKGDA